MQQTLCTAISALSDHRALVRDPFALPCVLIKQWGQLRQCRHWRKGPLGLGGRCAPCSQHMPVHIHCPCRCLPPPATEAGITSSSSQSTCTAAHPTAVPQPMISHPSKMEGPDVAPRGNPASPLLQLPHEVVASCILPHLGHWARGALRGSCRQLRTLVDGHCLEQCLKISLSVDEVQECGATRGSLRLRGGSGGVGPSATGAEITGSEKDRGPAAATCGTASAATSGPSSGTGGPLALVARSAAHTAALPPGYAARTVTRRVASATNVNTVYLSIRSKPDQQSPHLSRSTARLLDQLGSAWGERVTTLVLKFPADDRSVMQACTLALYICGSMLNVRARGDLQPM